jgi:hypothetical protein
MKEHSGSNNGLTIAQIKKKEADAKAKMFRHLGRKVGHELGIKEKRVVLETLDREGSVSGDVNPTALVRKLQMTGVHNEIKEYVKKQRAIKKRNASLRKAMKKEAGPHEGLAGKDFNAIEKAVIKAEMNAVTAADRAVGKQEHEDRKARYAKEKADLEVRIKAAKRVVKDDFIRFYRSIKSDKNPSDSDILAVATLAAHGFEILPGEHRYLKKHMLDDTTTAIRSRLVAQLDQEGIEGCDVCVLEEYMRTI